MAVEPLHVLAGLVADEESRAYQLLIRHGANVTMLADRLDLAGGESPPSAVGAHLPPPSDETRVLIASAAALARAIDRSREVGTEHLLCALAGSDGPAAALLESVGLRGLELIEGQSIQTRVETAQIPLSDDIEPLDLSTEGELADLARIADAASNRAREGLRVVEDYVRFVLSDAMLSRRLKGVRHRLALALGGLEDAESLILARDVEGDVGTHIMTVTEQIRENPRAVLSANMKRTAEALRSLEEFAKLKDVWVAGRLEALRYDVYTLEKLVLSAVAAGARMEEAYLYVLVGGYSTFNELVWIVDEAVQGGAQVVQLREKNLPDRTLLQHAAEVRKLTSRSGVKFIVNDRPDIARIVGADGVHLGQEDLTVRDAMRVMGTSATVGVSTHDVAQIERAAVDGATYLGVGPVFPSHTKQFDELAGLDFVREAAATTTRPWFAIGGITSKNLDWVLEAGARRIAVSSWIVHAGTPRETTAELRKRLDAART
jgi:thiamine-phosphate pyrophosphorylase